MILLPVARVCYTPRAEQFELMSFHRNWDSDSESMLAMVSGDIGRDDNLKGQQNRAHLAEDFFTEPLAHTTGVYIGTDIYWLRASGTEGRRDILRHALHHRYSKCRSTSQPV
jgi:hypothetical protein